MSEDQGLQVQADRLCFVCGPDNPAGLQARLFTDAEEGSAWCELTLDQRFQGWQGVIHGGILATLLDEVAIYACRTRGEQFVTSGIHVRYRKPVPVDSLIRVQGRILEQRRRIFRVLTQVEIAGECCAEAEVQVMRLGNHGKR